MKEKKLIVYDSSKNNNLDGHKQEKGTQRQVKMRQKENILYKRKRKRKEKRGIYAMNRLQAVRVKRKRFLTKEIRLKERGCVNYFNAWK